MASLAAAASLAGCGSHSGGARYASSTQNLKSSTGDIDPGASTDGQLVIYTIEPSSGSLAGGTAITLAGKGFGPNMRVLLGTSECTQLAVEPSGERAQCKSPSSAVAMSVNVTAVGGDGATFTLLQAFAYAATAGPVVTMVSPDRGSTLGGTLIAIEGSGFIPGAVVRVGASLCADPIVQGSSFISCMTQPGTAGPATVSVTIPNKPPGQKVNAFNFVAPVAPRQATYAADIRPMFAANCVSCHTGNQAKGNIRLNNINNARNNAAKALQQMELRLMPPTGPTDAQIELMRSWVAGNMP